MATMVEEDAALRSSASQTSASIHSGSNSHVLTLSELNDLALRGPEPGQINYYFLHQVIDTLIKELGLQEHPSLVLESYVSVDDAYLVPQTNSTQFNNASAAARRRSNASIAADEQQRRRSSTLRLVDLHGSKSQTERPGKKSTGGEYGTRGNKAGPSNLTSSSAIAVTGAKSAPSIAAVQQQHPNSVANNSNKTGRHEAVAAANPPAAVQLDHLNTEQNFDRNVPPASPAFTDASGFSAASTTGGSPRRNSPKDKIGVVVSKQQQHLQAAGRTPEERPTNSTAAGSSDGRKTGGSDPTSASPLRRALSRSNIPQHVGGSSGSGVPNVSANQPISGQTTPLNRRESGTSTNTTTIKVYNAVQPSGKKDSLTPSGYGSRPATDNGHVRARLDRLERFVQQLLAKGGAASADQIKSILDQIEALGGGMKYRPVDPDEVFERLSDAENRLRNLSKNVVDLQNASNKFKHFLDDTDGDDKTQDGIALKMTSSEIQRKAAQAQSDALLASTKASLVESKVDDGLAKAERERRALAAKAEAIAAEIAKAKASDKVTVETMDNMIRAHLAGIVSWGELDDALQEMRDSFTRFSLGAMASAVGGGTAEDAVAQAAAASLGSSKSAAALTAGGAGTVGAAKSRATAGGKAGGLPSSSAAGAAASGGATNVSSKSTSGADSKDPSKQKRTTSKKRAEAAGGQQQLGDDSQQQQQQDQQLPGKKRYRHISNQDKDEEDDQQQRMSLAERAARREEINARAAAWSAAKAARSPGVDSSADSSDMESNASPQSLSPPFNNRSSQQDPALVRSKENVFRQLEQLSRTGKTIPSMLDDLQVRLDKAATQAQVNSIIDEIASDLALQNQRIEQLANQLRLLEDQMLQLSRLNAQQQAASAAAAAALPNTVISTGANQSGSDRTTADSATGKTDAQLLAQRLQDAQKERDKAKKMLDQELSRASAELIKKGSKEDTATTGNVDNDLTASKLQLSDDWVKLQEARIQNLLDRIDALRAECESDRTEVLSTLNMLGAQLKDLQRNYSKLSKQLQEGSGSGASGKQGGRRRGAGRNNSQNPFAEDELDDLINECQNDIETLKAVVKDLALKDGEFDKAIEAIMELIERLQETKADKSIISTLLSTKADKKALETKISRSTFEMLETKWQGVMESTSDKLEALEKDLRIQKNRRAADYAAFATRAELRPLQDAINTDMRILKEQLERVIRVLELEEAAAVRKSWMRCIACDRKCDMPDHAQHPSVPYLPPMPLMAAASVEAYTAQHLAAAAMAAQSGESGPPQHFQHGGAGAAQNVADAARGTSTAGMMKLGGDSNSKPVSRYEQLLVRKDLTRNLMNHEVAYKNAYNSTQHKRDQHYSQERPVGGFHTLVAAAPKPTKAVAAARSSDQHRALEQ